MGSRAALDLVFGGRFNAGEPGIFEPIRDALLTSGDKYMHLADLKSYAAAHEAIVKLYKRPEEWTAKAVLNIAASGAFSSDRTIREYAKEIWGAEPVKIVLRRTDDLGG